MADLTTIILTFNEEKNIANAINSVKSLSKRIVVVDSFSTDKTVEIAKSLGAEVIQNKWINYSKQYVYAIENANITTQWIFRLDADEIVTKEARREIEEICLLNSNTDINDIVVRFTVNFLGRDLKHGGIYPFRKLLIYKAQYGNIEDKNMDEHIILSKGKVVELKNDCIHHDFKNLNSWIDKHNKYSNREVEDYIANKNKVDNEFIGMDSKSKIKNIIKFKIYYRMPIGLRSKLYYLYRYYFKLGFLDGKEGKIFAFMQAYWYRFLVDAKIYEKENSEVVDKK